MPQPGEHRVQPHAEGRLEDLVRVPGADGVDQLGPFDSLAQQEYSVGPGRQRLRQLVREEHAGGRLAVQPALVGQVVDGDHDGGPRDERVGLVGAVAQHHGRRGLPVVQVQDVDRPLVVQQSLDRGAAEQAEPPAVVDVVGRAIAVVALAVEGGRMIDEPDAIAAVFELDQVHVRDAVTGQGIGHGQRPGRGSGRDGHAAVPRQEDVDGRLDVPGQIGFGRADAHDRPGADPHLRLRQGRSLELLRRGLVRAFVDGSAGGPNRPGQRVHDVPEPARLGPWLAFGGDADDPH